MSKGCRAILCQDIKDDARSPFSLTVFGGLAAAKQPLSPFSPARLLHVFSSHPRFALISLLFLCRSPFPFRHSVTLPFPPVTPSPFRFPLLSLLSVNTYQW